MIDSVELRRIRPEDWALFKELRLEALADTPIAFLEVLADAAAQDDEHWQERARSGAEGGPAFQALALAEGRAVGHAGCVTGDGSAWLVAVYVAPPWRGQGLLGRLVAACARWAAERGHDRLLLEVHEDNLRARRAYARLGFTETGRRAPFPRDPGGEELTLALPVGPGLGYPGVLPRGAPR